jgi:hypothetical protein
VAFDDGGEADVPAGDLAPEGPVREAPSGARVVADPAEPAPEGWTRFVCFSDTSPPQGEGGRGRVRGTKQSREHRLEANEILFFFSGRFLY